MKYLLTASLLILATPVLAQTTEFEIKVTAQEADILWAGLRELPVKVAEPLMQKMRQQIMEQSAPKPPSVISPNAMAK